MYCSGWSIIFQYVVFQRMEHYWYRKVKSKELTGLAVSPIIVCSDFGKKKLAYLLKNVIYFNAVT